MLEPDYWYNGTPRYLDIGEWDDHGFDWNTGIEYLTDDYIY
jgi:hypothetical protein